VSGLGGARKAGTGGECGNGEVSSGPADEPRAGPVCLGGLPDLGLVEVVLVVMGKRLRAGGVRHAETGEDLVGAADDQVASVEGEGWAGTIPNRVFEAGPVSSFYADAGVEAEPAAVVPGEHVLGLVGFGKGESGRQCARHIRLIPGKRAQSAGEVRRPPESTPRSSQSPL